MILRNQTRHTIISSDLQIARSLKQRSFGLLNPQSSRSLLIHTRFGIHTWGLQTLIDVVVLDDKLRVVKIKSGLAPNGLFFWNPLYATVIELPFKSITASNTKVGDILKIKN